MKKIIKWFFIMLILGIISSGITYRLTMGSMDSEVDSKQEAETSSSQAVKRDNVKEFKNLVDYSTVKPPKHASLKSDQHEIFYTTPQIRSVRSSIQVLHQDLDYKLRPEVVVKKDAAFWAQFSGSGSIIGNSTIDMVTRIDNTISKLNDEILVQDLKNVQALLSEGTKEQDIKKLWTAHCIVHDLDYFLFNYPVIVKKGQAAVKDSLNGPEQYWGATKFLSGI